MNTVNGSAEQYVNCYGPTWGRHKYRTRPTPGNHDYEISGGAAYYAYFGANAGPAGRGYYSFNVSGWHVISLNSNIAAGAGSPQLLWLQADLQENPAQCTAAYWHTPLFTSGPNGNNPLMRDVWRVLYDAGAEIALSGHDHFYQRFAPQDADGRLDRARGIRQFVVGTGGAGLYGLVSIQANSEAWGSAHGVLRLILHAASYEWEFQPVPGNTFVDAGIGACH